jgi:asparagine synthase (glutamine-hydrolysing)
MCGICGILNFRHDQPAERGVLEEMNRQIIHRGPDEAGFFLSGNIGMAMRRLSIIDVQSGHQPVTNEDDSISLVFNGEIYNHQELRQRLEQRGHRYRSHSDTETIVHLYEEYGQDCVTHLRGMFAFAIWDSRRRTLFIARDRLGIKPLYFLLTDEHLLFASEIKALLAHPEVRAEFNRDVLPEYLAFGYLSGPRTMFTGIKKLLPGHTIEIDESGDIRIQQYWDLPQNAKQQANSEKYYVDTYRELLEGSVASHLMSDVPLGVFLSGGLDSSAIAALMSKIRKEPIETFAVGYDEEAYSELRYARIVAEHIGSVHYEVRVSSKEFFGALPKLIWHEDEPIVWPSSVPLYFVARLASERVKVVLTGEGSDETLGGYARYPWTIWNSRFDHIYRSVVPSRLRKRIREQIGDSGRLGAAARRRLQHTFLGRDAESWSSFYFDSFYCAFSESDQTDLLLPERQGGSGSAYLDNLAYWESAKGDLLDRLLYTDIKTYLVELCMKQDQMSMAASIESRVPFLDHVLVEFAASIPARFKTRGMSGKLILKSAVKDLLPESIIHRRKMGFPTPLAKWILGPQLETLEKMLLSPHSMGRGLFRPEAVRRLFAEHRANRRDHSDRIWRLLNLEIWHRVFIDRDPAILDSTAFPASVVGGQ